MLDPALSSFLESAPLPDLRVRKNDQNPLPNPANRTVTETSPSEALQSDGVPIQTRSRR